MESHPNYSMCYSNFETVDENNDLVYWPNRVQYLRRSKTGDNFRELIKGNYIMTLTMFYRKNILDDPLFKGGLDYALAFQCVLLGTCYYSQEIMSHYRLHEDSMIHTKQNWISQKKNECWKYYIKRYLNSKEFRRRFFEHVLICGTIDARLISHYRSGSDEREYAKMMIKECPILKWYLLLGLMLRLYHTIMKRFK